MAEKSAGEVLRAALREQVGAQCNAVNHLATAIAQLYGDYAKLFHEGGADKLLEPVGKRTAALMEKLGDVLNATDANSEDDDWLIPVFKEAQRLWPSAAPVNAHAELIEALKNAIKSLDTDGPESAAASLNTIGRKAIALAETGEGGRG